ncbi:MAG: DUF2953 domain-containing protein [Clostridia bacterium]|nr:DUF2953 domain-containing protein [Clostridia bacterium]
MPLFLYILLGVILFISFLLFVPVVCRITYKEDLAVSLHILCFRFSLYPEKPKRAKKKKRDKQKKEMAPVKEAQKKKAPASVFTRIKFILRLLKRNYPHIISSVKMRLLRLKIQIGGKDAAETAILYGGAALALSAFLEMLEGFCRFSQKKGAVSLSPNFLDDTSTYDLLLTLSTNLFRVIGLGLRLALDYLKNKSHLSSTAPKKQDKGTNTDIHS